MSFGASAAVRFETHDDGNRRPVIFWEKPGEVAGNNKRPKKLSYKTKKQPYPLRNQQRVAPEEPVAKPNNRVPTSKKTTAGQETKESINKKPAAGQNSQLPSSKKKEEKRYGAKNKKVPETAGTVVLTQKEFDAILDTIGQLALEAERNVTNPSNRGRKSKKPADNDVLNDPSVSVELTPADGVHNTKATPRDGELAMAKELPPSPAIVMYSSVEPSQSMTHAVTSQAVQMSQAQFDQAAKPSVTTTTASVSLATRAPGVSTSMDKPLNEVLNNTRGVPLAHMTKAERKRLQWEQERAEQVKDTEWNPWGRPGGGAPIKDNTGNILADYKTRACDTSVLDHSLNEHTIQNTNRSQGRVSQPRPSYAPPTRSMRNTIAAGLPAHRNTSVLSGQFKTSQVNKPPTSMMQTAPPTLTTLTGSNQGMITTPTTAAIKTDVQPPPAAIRSSFVVGELEPNEKRFESAKEQQRRQWLAELEKQREEQRLRKLCEKTSRLEGETYDTWADHFSTYKPTGLPNQQPSPRHVTEAQQMDTNTQRINSAPVVPPGVQVSPAHPDSQSENRTYLRGQNVFIDSQTLQELDEKRRKQLDYQEFIRKQIEEKERQKREEKERRMREEQEEEERLRKERERIEGCLQHEKNQVKLKEEQERQRLEALRQAVEDAQLKAEQEKHTRRMTKLQQAGHDTTHLAANFETKLTPRADGATSNSLIQTTVGTHNVSLPDNKRDDRSGKELKVDQSYQGNRILTPSKFRQSVGSEPSSPRKEFGVQTDLQVVLSDAGGVSRESTDIEYHGPLQEKKKKVRVQSAPKQQLPAKKSSKSVLKGTAAKEEAVRGQRTQKLSQRPSWGYRNPPKMRPIKQSEKDPFYEEKIQKREMMKTQRQIAMHKMADKYSPKASKVTTVSSRARSRSRDRDESEERKTILRSRSRSPPAEHHGQVQHRSRKDSGGNRSESSTVPAVRSMSRSSSQGPRGRSVSPPVPAIKHRLNSDSAADNYQQMQARDMTARTTSRSDYPSSSHNKYQDPQPVQAPVKNSDFVPFIRSSNILDPAHAESPVPLSREASVVERARRAYIQELNPAKFGFHMDNYKDDGLRRIVTPQSPPRNKKGVNPILNPEAVKEHPTNRQTQILQHLSDLRRGLMQKQRELELEQAVCVE